MAETDCKRLYPERSYTQFDQIEKEVEQHQSGYRQSFRSISHQWGYPHEYCWPILAAEVPPSRSTPLIVQTARSSPFQHEQQSLSPPFVDPSQKPERIHTTYHAHQPAYSRMHARCKLHAARVFWPRTSPSEQCSRARIQSRKPDASAPCTSPASPSHRVRKHHLHSPRSPLAAKAIARAGCIPRLPTHTSASCQHIISSLLLVVSRRPPPNRVMLTRHPRPMPTRQPHAASRTGRPAHIASSAPGRPASCVVYPSVRRHHVWLGASRRWRALRSRALSDAKLSIQLPPSCLRKTLRSGDAQRSGLEIPPPLKSCHVRTLRK
ncbi:hypothetical protein IWX47DRAFT_247217 [Phyllosticta citricarpa]